MSTESSQKVSTDLRRRVEKDEKTVFPAATSPKVGRRKCYTSCPLSGKKTREGKPALNRVAVGGAARLKRGPLNREREGGDLSQEEDKQSKTTLSPRYPSFRTWESTNHTTQDQWGGAPCPRRGEKRAAVKKKKDVREGNPTKHTHAREENGLRLKEKEKKKRSQWSLAARGFQEGTAAHFGSLGGSIAGGGLLPTKERSRGPSRLIGKKSSVIVLLHLRGGPQVEKR